jgi:hypothetical protein
VIVNVLPSLECDDDAVPASMMVETAMGIGR